MPDASGTPEPSHGLIREKIREAGLFGVVLIGMDIADVKVSLGTERRFHPTQTKL